MVNSNTLGVVMKTATATKMTAGTVPIFMLSPYPGMKYLGLSKEASNTTFDMMSKSDKND